MKTVFIFWCSSVVKEGTSLYVGKGLKPLLTQVSENISLDTEKQMSNLPTFNLKCIFNIQIVIWKYVQGTKLK